MPDCCTGGDDVPIQSKEIRPLTVTLEYLELPASYTYQGGNRSPAVRLTGLDPKAETIVLMVFNPFIKTCCSFSPWIIWNIPPLNRIPEGIPPGIKVEDPVSAIQGMNDYGEPGYHGPEPPAGEMHRYQFRVYVLDSYLLLAGGASKNELIAAMKGHVIQYGETVAMSSG